MSKHTARLQQAAEQHIASLGLKCVPYKATMDFRAGATACYQITKEGRVMITIHTRILGDAEWARTIPTMREAIAAILYGVPFPAPVEVYKTLTPEQQAEVDEHVVGYRHYLL